MGIRIRIAMDLQFFMTNIGNPGIIIPAIIKEWKQSYELKAFKEYEPEFHNVKDTAKRPDKLVSYPDPTGATTADGGPVIMAKTELVARIAAPIQKLIVKIAAAFLTGGKIAIEAKPEGDKEQKLLDVINKTWRENKLQYRTSVLAKKVMAETECAEIWYSRKDSDNKVSMRCKVYSPSEGYGLIPVFDQQGDMIAFGLQYEDVSKRKRYMDLYTKDFLRRYETGGAEWILRESTPEMPAEVQLKYGKLPVIYYCQPKAEWADVQTMIDRLETMISNFCDTNDYNGSPILFAKGEISGFAQKGEAGKIIESTGDDADLKYVTWAQVPEAIKFEFELLMRLIYSCTQTPDLSFEAMKGLGDISGVAFDRIMIGAHLKAKDKQEGEFGEGIQRRLNFLVAACAEITPGLEGAKDMEIAPVFNLFKLDNVKERIEAAMAANGGKPVIDHRGSIAMANLSDDADATFDAINEDEAPVTTNTDIKPGNKAA